MTSEDDFQRRLDAHPEDWQTRLVFADWLEDRGDPRAEGYRAMKPGCCFYAPLLSCWCVHLPADWERCIPGGLGFATRRAAEDAASLAFASLTAERRSELLAACVVA